MSDLSKTQSTLYLLLITFWGVVLFLALCTDALLDSKANQQDPQVKGIPLPDHIAKALEGAAAFSPHPSDILIDSYPKSVMSDNQPVIPRSLIVKVQGVSLPDHIAKAFEAASAFTPDPSDLLISSYPKSGTTWIQEIVDLLLHNGDDGSSKRASIVKRHPFLEASTRLCKQSGLDLLKEMDPPRVIKTHMPLQLVPAGFWENKCKIIYIARNAKDTLVSYYHFLHMSKISAEPGPWEGFIHKFMRGELGWGSWYDHVKGYWEEREKRNILYLFYEDMKENPRREVERIMKYLDLYLPDDVISHVVEMTTFKNMEENPMVNYSFFGKEIFDQSISKFMRKGEIGDWKNHFTPEQSAEFDEDYQSKMKNVNIPFRAQF